MVRCLSCIDEKAVSQEDGAFGHTQYSAGTDTVIRQQDVGITEEELKKHKEFKGSYNLFNAGYNTWIF